MLCQNAHYGNFWSNNYNLATFLSQEQSIFLSNIVVDLGMTWVNNFVLLFLFFLSFSSILEILVIIGKSIFF